MKRTTSLVCLFLLLTGTIASAERDLVPTLNNQPDVCPDLPPEPEWMRNTEARDAHKRLLVQQIYRFQSMERIVDAQSCTCVTRYPSWEAAEAVYFDRYSAADYWSVVEATSDYRRQANDLRKQAMPICEAAGNW
ncbi:hypothetical protein PVW51_22100 [Sulfitobacter sp. PR48]|uniref:hypothetical protein n=1 Tax=Sulfitobacter sp. PR48 TaxID=3028383 RepID=UPI00237B4B5D|nr:hypothetical protein [Sulfitobacter sp. PR48]MDD9723405.1 hypothetical protein [Sulfitobacter sp. PR48]